MTYYLKTIYSRQDGYEHLAELAKATNKLRAERLELDFSKVTFFDANMSSPLGAVLTRVADRFNAIEITNVSGQIEDVLRKNGFLTQYRFQPLEDAGSTTIPFRRLQSSEEGLFAEYLQQHLQGKGIPRMSQDLWKLFKQKIFEIFQNAGSHAASDLGVFVCGQFFPQKQRLALTITDAGIGIRENVRRYFNGWKISSVSAIRWALEDGHTTKTGNRPGGLGLKLLQDFARLNKGRIHIVSRFGFYEFDAGIESFCKMVGDFPGTAVTLEVNTADSMSYWLASENPNEDIF
jgi:anti-sigma regulatory factor (Ser/Thr protein kinase)